MAKKTKAVKLPVATGNVSEGPSDTMSISRNAKYEAEERRYRAEDGMKTLARAEEIRRDKPLMKDIKSHAKTIQKAICK